MAKYEVENSKTGEKFGTFKTMADALKLATKLKKKAKKLKKSQSAIEVVKL